MKNGQNDFCPKCGALRRDGVCQSCGNAAGEVPEEENYYTPLVAPAPATDLRAMKEQRKVQNGQSMCGAPGQIPQNGRPGCGGMPPVNNGIPMGAVPPQNHQKNNSNLAIFIVCIIAVLAAVFVLAAGIFVQQSVKRMREEQKIRVEEEWPEVWEYDEDYGYDDYEYDDYEPYEGDEPYEDENDSLYGDTPDALYYERLTDSIDYNVNYEFSFEEYLSENEDAGNLDYHVYYVLLDGEKIPNLERINALLEYYSKWYVKYAAGKQAENGVECYVSSYAYVTYNDEYKVSIVLSESIQIGDEYYVELYPINIDLVNGIVVNNTDMIEIDAEFVKDFRKRSRKQNDEALPSLTDEQIYNLMKDEGSLIVFYTPVGLEVGVNYETEQGYSGWVTVTYKDYQNFLSLSG